jgi:hypothetical protein
MLLRGAVGEVEPGDVHPRLEERPQGLLGGAGRADRGDDLRPPISVRAETLNHNDRPRGAA